MNCGEFSKFLCTFETQFGRRGGAGGKKPSVATFVK
jgi:hypothetical protein